MADSPEDEFSRRSLARLALSVTLAELADAAARLVPTFDDGSLESGTMLESVRMLVVKAEEALGRAALVERLSGASWSSLGEVLGTSKQAAQQKFGDREQDWKSALDAELLAGTSFLPGDGSETASVHAVRLDAWCKSRGVGHRPKGPQVSSGLLPASTVEQIAVLARLARQVVHEQDPKKVRAFFEYKARVLARVASEDPNNAELQEAAEQARAALSPSSPSSPQQPPDERAEGSSRARGERDLN